MIISSEITGKTYKTVEDCLAAEKEAKLKEAREKAAKEEREKEIEDAYCAARKAYEHFMDVAKIDEDDARALELQMILDIL